MMKKFLAELLTCRLGIVLGTIDLAYFLASLGTCGPHRSAAAQLNEPALFLTSIFASSSYKLGLGGETSEFLAHALFTASVFAQWLLIGVAINRARAARSFPSRR